MGFRYSTCWTLDADLIVTIQDWIGIYSDLSCDGVSNLLRVSQVGLHGNEINPDRYLYTQTCG